MNKESFYKITIVILLLLNCGVLGFLWFHHGPPHEGPPGRGNGPDRMIIERLHLDDKQRDQFETLKHEHHGQMLEIGENSAKLHQQLFDLLKKDPIDSISRNNLLASLQQNDRQKELVTFEHFRKLRGILHPDQVKDFDDLVQELSRHLLGQRP